MYLKALSRNTFDHKERSTCCLVSKKVPTVRCLSRVPLYFTYWHGERLTTGHSEYFQIDKKHIKVHISWACLYFLLWRRTLIVCISSSYILQDFLKTRIGNNEFPCKQAPLFHSAMLGFVDLLVFRCASISGTGSGKSGPSLCQLYQSLSAPSSLSVQHNSALSNSFSFKTFQN